jgi:dihydroorotate dehydrogenase (fumarate)
MRSIFEEQITREQMAAHRHLDGHEDAERSGVMADTPVFALGVDAYLEQLRRIRERTALKVIGSINGASLGGWTEYARSIQVAGAHALELNLYAIPSDARTAGDVEAGQLAVIREVQRAITIPFAVKLSPFYSSLPHFLFAAREAGARGAVLFNRLYQADIDPIRLEAVRALHLSTPGELPLRLRWLALLSPECPLDLAASGGVHHFMDVVKALMAGAVTVQVVSCLLKRGPEHLAVLRDGLARFLEEQEYPTLAAMRGNMSRTRCPDPGAYERADYMQILQSWHGP